MKVNHLHLAADGIDVASPQRAHAYSFYAKAPGGFLVEVGA
jgi:lactoylglutathione lyase